MREREMIMTSYSTANCLNYSLKLCTLVMFNAFVSSRFYVKPLNEISKWMEFLTVLVVKITVLSEVKPCIPVEMYEVVLISP